MESLKFLENFDAPSPPPVEELPVFQQPGYDAGYAAGQAAEAGNQQALKAELIEKLTDMSFVYAEARNDVMASLAPLFSALVDKLLPDLVDAITHARLVACLVNAAEEDTQAPLHVSVAPANLDAIQSSLPDTLKLPLSVTANASLLDKEIRISRAGQATSLNAQRLIDDIRAILSTVKIQQEEEFNHG